MCTQQGHSISLPTSCVMIIQDGSSPLMTACQKGHAEVVKSLIDAGANISHTNQVGIHTVIELC